MISPTIMILCTLHFYWDHCVSPVLGSSLPIYPEIDKSNETNVFSCHLVYFLLPIWRALEYIWEWLFDATLHLVISHHPMWRGGGADGFIRLYLKYPLKFAMVRSDCTLDHLVTISTVIVGDGPEWLLSGAELALPMLQLPSIIVLVGGYLARCPVSG